MTFRRATAYIGLGSVLVAWLAGAAALTSGPSGAPEPPARAQVSATQAIADEVQHQASRLRSRLATAPSPREPFRNPFTFAPRAARPSGPSRPPAATETTAPDPPAGRAAEPPLQLVGMAERQTPAGLVRTAMITSDSDELFMLVEGDTLGGRYRVRAVGAEGVELTDLVTGAARRLTLR